MTYIPSDGSAGLQSPTHLSRGGLDGAVSGTPGMLKRTFRLLLQDFDGLSQDVHAHASFFAFEKAPQKPISKPSAFSGTSLIVAPLGVEAWGSNPYS